MALSPNTIEQKQDKVYLDAEKTWSSLTTDIDKKFMSWQYLSWCKKQRDIFDYYTPYSWSPSVGNGESAIEFIDQRENKWAARVTIWRQRFDETESHQ